ncbi:MAG: glycosyltransferase family 4 protein [Gammaproteobacteria bacterium]|nr:glycosyltransferase family 4 protein [Gammaproteobacteria bacterium]
MARVLQLTSTYPQSKDDKQPRFIEYLCDELKGSHEVTVLAPSLAGSKSCNLSNSRTKVIRYRYFFKKYELLAGVDGIMTNLKMNKALYFLIPFFLLAQLISVVTVCRRNSIEVIHAHWVFPQGIIAVIAKMFLRDKPKILLTSHGADLFTLNSFVFKKIKTYVITKSDRFAVVSKYMKEFCVKQLLIPASDVSVISMGVDLRNIFKPSTYGNRKGLVFVGRLVEKKGLDILLQALSILNDRNHPVLLTIIGGGAQSSLYKEMAVNLNLSDLVEFTGPVENDRVARYLQKSEVAVFPFRVADDGDTEGLGLTTIEAIGCGCLVVVSDLPAIRDVVEHKHTGLLFDSSDPRNLADAIELALSGELDNEKLIGAARMHVIKKYDWKVIGKAYSELISTL